MLAFIKGVLDDTMEGNYICEPQAKNTRRIKYVWINTITRNHKPLTKGQKKNTITMLSLELKSNQILEAHTSFDYKHKTKKWSKGKKWDISNSILTKK